MNVEKKMIRSDIPGHNAMLTGTLPYGASAPVVEEQRRLTVGRDITLVGEITSCQHLVIEGTVEAKTLVTNRLDILETGSFTGTAEVEDAIIAGRFSGTLVVKGRLTVKSTAHITGEIEYGALEIEAGSRIEARISARPAKPVAEKAPVVTAKTTSATEAADKAPDASNDQADAAAVTEERPGTFRRAVGY